MSPTKEQIDDIEKRNEWVDGWVAVGEIRLLIEAARALAASEQKREAMESAHDKEIGDFQNEVRNLVIKLSGAPDSSIDGKGSDAGWEEFTLSEIAQGFNFIKDQLTAAKLDGQRLDKLDGFKTGNHEAPYWKIYAVNPGQNLREAIDSMTKDAR